MDKKTVCAVILVGFLIGGTGCLGLPVDGDAQQDTNVTFIGNNEVEAPHTFEVFVVDLPANFTKVRNDGLHYEGKIRQGVGPAYPGDGYYYTEVSPDPQASHLHGNFTVRDSGSVTSNITSLRNHGALLVAVYDDAGQIIGYVSANCDDLALTYLKINADNEGVSVTSSCN